MCGWTKNNCRRFYPNEIEEETCHIQSSNRQKLFSQAERKMACTNRATNYHCYDNFMKAKITKICEFSGRKFIKTNVPRLFQLLYKP
jgi:hypothetical protein